MKVWNFGSWLPIKNYDQATMDKIMKKANLLFKEKHKDPDEKKSKAPILSEVISYTFGNDRMLKMIFQTP